MNSTLLEIFNNTKEWLRFAEAKNGMLIAFNAASIYGVAQLPFFNDFEKMTFWKGYFIMIVLILIASTIACLISFVPRLTLLNSHISNINQEGNILFFENLRETNPTQILENIKAKEPDVNFTKLDEDLAQQIHSIAKVTSNKYALFNIAVWITVVAYITLPIAGIFWLYNRFK